MSTRVLLVEDDPADAHVFRRHLRTAGYATVEGDNGFELEHATQLASGLDRLSRGRFQVLVLDLGLPDSQGLETFFSRPASGSGESPSSCCRETTTKSSPCRLYAREPRTTWLKHELTGALLVRSIRYAIERNQLQQNLRHLSLRDDLTGLYNRRGFQTLAEQQLKQVRRTRRTLSVLFADLDGLKTINDTLGHHVGDSALIEAGRLLTRSFRDTDIVARFGGDEFAVLLVDAGEGHRGGAPGAIRGQSAAL